MGSALLMPMIFLFPFCFRRVGDVPDLTADPALAEKELGFKAPRVLEEMCRDQWNWQSYAFFSLSLCAVQHASQICRC